MTKAQFITAIEAKNNFIQWEKVPERKVESSLDSDTIQHWWGLAYISRPEGTQKFNVWFFWDSVNDVANWQDHDTVGAANDAEKATALTNYLKDNFAAFFVNRADYTNNWAEADVYTLANQVLTKSTVLVYKVGNNPISHKAVN